MIARSAACLMVQGTASGVGKSVLTAALCRLFARAGVRVAPFKSQNMALNAAVAADGGEIGRAQAAQAEAAGVAPSVDMNPILLKPEADDRSQVVVRGVPLGSMGFGQYTALRPELFRVVQESLERLRARHDVVVIEGAGSPAEINLNDGELVNMRVARLADAPVLLVGDIHRGGVFAAFVGTLALLDDEDRRRIAGLVVNRFRGERALLDPGLEVLAGRTGVPVLGVVPWIDALGVPAEDSLDLDDAVGVEGGGRGAGVAVLDIAVVRLPRIANFDDVEPLGAEPGVRVRFVDDPAALGGADLVVLPGSKSTVADLEWLRERGLGRAVAGAAAEGRPILGICGGYQMLGRALRDPDRVESATAEVPGLGLLPVVTTFAARKTTVTVRLRAVAGEGLFAAAGGAEGTAYEIHCGRTALTAGTTRPFVVVERAGVSVHEPDGATSAGGRVVGTYLHGVLANPPLRRALLEHLARRRGLVPDPRWGVVAGPDRYDRLADVVGRALDLRAIGRLVGVRLGR